MPVPTGIRTERRSQAERTAKSDHEIFRAAIELISEKGPRDVTLAEIGKLAGYSGPLISHRFGSKSGLLIAITERIVELFLNQLLSNALKSGEPFKDLIAFMQVYLRQAANGSSLFRCFYLLMNESYATLPELLPEFQSINLRMCHAIEQKILAGMVDGDFLEDLDPAFEALVFVAQLRGLANLWLVGPRSYDLEGVASRQREFMVQRWLKQ